MKSDIEIAQSTKLKPILEIAKKAGLSEDDIEYYGKYKAKVDLSVMNRAGKEGKLILVTAITPTPAGEGKTTTTIGLADGMRRIGKNVVVALREPSLGPVFGVKGGAAGGGYAQVVPMEDINLHFTGDMHAIGAAANLLAAMLDNHIFQGNALGIDKDSITWKRCVDMNDRQLRFIEDGLGGGKNGVPRKDGYEITVANEVMAILCLSTSLTDLKERLKRIVVGYTFEGKPVTAGALKAAGAMCALLKDALKPNLVQTLEGTPALVHGGPFANIAHGCNSIVATRTALKLGDYVVTEAGFGADLGAEKFLDIKCRFAHLKPSACVVVATVRALKMHGGVAKTDLAAENLPALGAGLPNLLRHVRNMKEVYGLPTVVALNRFPPIPMQRSRLSWRNAKSWVLKWFCPLSGRMAARAAKRSPRQFALCANSRIAFAIAMTRRFPSRRRSRRSSRTSTAATVWSTRPKRKLRFRVLRGSASEERPSAWQRRSILSRTTPKSSVHPSISLSRCAM